MTSTTPTIRPCDTLQLLLVRALSPHSEEVRPVTFDNSLKRAVDWSRADHESPYAVHVGHHGRFHTLALDFDAGADGVHADRATRDAHDARHLLQMAGIRSVMTQSGPSGGRHVFATVRGGASESTMRRIVDRMKSLGLDTLDISCMTNVRSGAIRPPLAPHRREGRSELISHGATEALAILNAPQPKELFDLLATSLAIQPRRQRLRSSSTGEARSDRVPAQPRTYASGSEAVAAVATKLVNRRGSFEDFRRAVQEAARTSPAVAASLSKRKRSGELERWLHRTWASAEEFVRRNPAKYRGGSGDDQATIASWAYSVPRITSSSAKRAAEALHAEAQRQGRALVGMSVRTVAERSNQSRGSVQRGLQWLTDHGMVEKADEGDYSHAARYRLIHADLWGCDGAGTVGSQSLGGVGWPTVPGLSHIRQMATDLTLDIWCHEGLGEPGRTALLALSQGQDGGGDVHVSVVAARLNVVRRTAERTLKRLGDVGLARRLGQGVWTAEYRDPAEVAELLGVAGWHARLLDRHAAERRQHSLRRIESRIAYLLTTERWRHLDGLVRSRQIENHSQIEPAALPMGQRQLIVIEQPPTKPSLRDAADHLALPDYEPSAAALDATGGSN